MPKCCLSWCLLFILEVTPSDKCGCDVTYVFKEGLGLKVTHFYKHSILANVEHLKCSLDVANIHICMLVIYRPPLSIYNDYTIAILFNELSSFPDRLTTVYEKVINTGDLNVYFDVHP